MTSAEIPESELIKNARQGDETALTEIVNRYSDRLYTLLVRMLRDKEEAEDALQETFITMIQKIGSFRGGSQLYTWLYRIASNTALMRLRKTRGYKVTVDEQAISERVHRGEITPLPLNPEEHLSNQELKEILDSAIDKLPPHFRAVFILRDVEQLSVKEAARILKISADNVKTRLRRARMQLRDYLAENLT
ncbi:RNA polymerase sigma factor [candidate division KSB1 bacterium]